mgnify:CR=1 FL=1
MGWRRNGSIAVILTRATPRYAATVFFVKLPVLDISPCAGEAAQIMSSFMAQVV